MEVAIVPIAEEHVMAFHSCLDVVARERCYLGFLAAPPLESMRRFVRANIENGHVQLVALADGTLLVGVIFCPTISLVLRTVVL